MGFPLPIPTTLRESIYPGTSVLVALSGGVDSSVALALLHELECELFAVTFKNFCYGEDYSSEYSEENTSTEKSCCSLEAIEDARSIARRFSAQHWVSDVTDLFRDMVIEPFVAEYAAGRTPNPCLSCNATVRFPALVRLADQLGIDRVATGHYARMEIAAEIAAESHQLLRGVDEEKDQAYFLYRIGRNLFPRILFPLGWYRKTDVREAARAMALPVASKHESQEICFVPDGDRSFLFYDREVAKPGDIVNRAGSILGRHQGLVHYTVGQRRGLGIAASEPLYVLALDQARNLLVVGPEPELAVQRIICDSFIASIEKFPVNGPVAKDGRHYLARIRHRHAGAPVKSWSASAKRLVVDLAEPVKGVAPGQSVVLYEDDIVLGGGRIIGSE